MNLEIHKPELAQRVQAQIESGHFHDTDELIEKALDALDVQAAAAAPTAAVKTPQKDIEELFALLRGLNLDFSRNPSTGRPVDCERLSTRHQCPLGIGTGNLPSRNG
jgi:hypothetical protein